MKPETSIFLQQSNRYTERARSMLDAGLCEDAGRSAYFVAFHAAQAFIFERTGKVAKTHNGVHTEFSRLARAEIISATTIRFLPEAYLYKQGADYFTGNRTSLSNVDAEAAFVAAERFLASVLSVLDDPAP